VIRQCQVEGQKKKIENGTHVNAFQRGPESRSNLSLRLVLASVQTAHARVTEQNNRTHGAVASRKGMSESFVERLSEPYQHPCTFSKSKTKSPLLINLTLGSRKTSVRCLLDEIFLSQRLWIAPELRNMSKMPNSMAASKRVASWSSRNLGGHL
jgi:hypothetical protein